MSCEAGGDLWFGSLEDRTMYSAAAPLAGAGAVAMAYDLGGVLHVAYADGDRGTLRYTTRSADGTWSPGMTVDATPGSGAQLSLAVDSAGRPAIAYHDAAHDDLRFARLDGKRWTITTVESKGNVGGN